jgi:alpha-L-rhamnosidase
MIGARKISEIVLQAAMILVCFAAGVPHLAASSAAPPPIGLRVEYLVNPIGVDARAPRFQWLPQSSERNEKQTAYQILVSTSAQLLAKDDGNVWDSGKVSSEDSAQIAYAGKPLLSGHRYLWKVRAWDKQGAASPYCEPAYFEMGLLKPSDWQGKWIGGFSMLRKEFTLAGRVERARAYVTALGYYELHVNGKKVGHRVLDPAWTVYPKRVLYSTYDVTRLLKPGPNAAGAMLGGGWATEAVGKPYYSQPAFLLQLNIELEGGRKISIVSDGSWQGKQGPVVSDSVYDGEAFDARREVPGWDETGLKDAGWAAAKILPGTEGALSSEMMPPIRVVDTLTPVSMANPEPGVYVYDFGQNTAGWAELRVSGPRGATVRLRYSELIYPDGMINRANLRTAKSRDLYTLRGGGREVYEPRFTYHGFRYVELTGYPGTPSLETLRARVVHSAVASTGSFVASKQILNQIQHLILWGQLSNLMSIPTDCDQRNERQGWMGDAQVSAEEAMMNFDMAAFYTNFIRDIHDSQHADGSVPDTVPHKYGQYPADPAWGTAYPLLCWYMWQQYGDRRILEENYDGLKKYVEFLRSRAQDNVLRYSYYGDWVALEPTPGALVSDFYFDYDTQILASVAKILGKTGDAAAYSSQADQIKDAFNKAFYNPQTQFYANGSQTSQALPLFLDLFENPLRRYNYDPVLAHLTNDITYGHNTHLTTGFIGVKYLLPVLSSHGRNDLAYELATQTTYPSWGYMIRRGATTLWELWQKKTGPSMNSHDHIMFGSLGAWFYRALGGIRQANGSAGYRHLEIDPGIVEDLRWASASMDTVQGRVSSSWARSPGAIELEVTIPVGSEAAVVVPKEEEMSADTLKISEGGRVIWENGNFIPGDPGVTGAEARPNGVSFEVGSGRYTFELTGE